LKKTTLLSGLLLIFLVFGTSFVLFGNFINYDLMKEEDNLKTSDLHPITFHLFAENGIILDTSEFFLYIGGDGLYDGDFVQFGELVYVNVSEDVLIKVYEIKLFNILVFYDEVNLIGISEYNITCKLAKLTINLNTREIGHFTLTKISDSATIIFDISPNTSREFILEYDSYSATWLNTEDGSEYEYNFNMDLNNKEITLNSIFYNVSFKLLDQLLNELNTSYYSLYIDGIEEDFGLIELNKSSVLITVYDKFNVVKFNSIILLEGLTIYNIIISIYNLIFTLSDQFLNELDTSHYSLHIDGIKEEFGSIELYDEEVLITVYDRFGIVGFSQFVILTGLSEYNIIVPIYKLKIENLASKIGNFTLKEKITQNTYDFSLKPDSSRIFKLRSANYTIIWLNGENLQVYEYNIDLISDFELILNSIYYIVFFSIFNFDGIGLDDNLVRFYINGIRFNFGNIELNSINNDLLILDFFNNIIYNETINLSGKTEWNIYVEMYNIEIKNAYNYAIDLIFERNGFVVEITIPAQFSLEYRFILDVNYNITWYKSSDDSYVGNTEITFTKENLIISFGVVVDIIVDNDDILKSSSNELLIWIISIISIIVISILGILLKYRKKIILYIHKRKGE